MLETLALPTWWASLLVAALLISVTVSAAIMVTRNRASIARAHAWPGLFVVGFGVCVLVLIYLLDFTAMAVMPTDAGSGPAEGVFSNYGEVRWHVAAVAALLMLAGVLLLLSNLLKRLEAVTEFSRSLENNKSLYESIFNNIPMGLIVKNRESVVENVNRTYLNWYGFAREEIIGQRTNRAASFRFDSHMTSAADLEKACLETGVTGFHQIARTFATGDVHMIRVTKFPIRDSSGEIVSVGSVSVDMTELIKAKLAAEDARQKAEEASNAKSDFLATMSHEFRTPLNAIIGLSGMLNEQVFGPLGSEKYGEYARGIYASGNMMLELVNNVLDISEIEAGERALDFAEVDIEDIIAECRRVIDPVASEKSIVVNYESSDGPFVILGDRRSLNQVLMNVLANAVKFSHVGGQIDISVDGRDTGVSIEITDYGQGIGEEHLAKIIDPFYRGDADPHVTQSGTGLGLAIVKNLVDLHNGHINIRSAPGQGTSVAISLPYAQKTEREIEQARDKVS